jgi:Uncharacterized conserved protein
MVTVIKLNPAGHEMIRYEGETIARDTYSIVIQAFWTLPARELGYTRFEPGDRFIEYYYTDRWYSIFDIANAAGVRKGWYCNIVEPAHILTVGKEELIKQVDLYLDLWVRPDRQALLLDEDEFATAVLSPTQRLGAHQGLQELRTRLQQHLDAFA